MQNQNEKTSKELRVMWLREKMCSFDKKTRDFKPEISFVNPLRENQQGRKNEKNLSISNRDETYQNTF